jgi:poly(3-hydroxybutyrate) depolymerase
MVLINRAGAVVTLLGFVVSNCANKDGSTSGTAHAPGTSDGGSSAAGRLSSAAGGSAQTGGGPVGGGGKVGSAGHNGAGGSGGTVGAAGSAGQSAVGGGTVGAAGSAGQSAVGGGTVGAAGSAGQSAVGGGTAQAGGGSGGASGSSSMSTGCGVTGKPTGDLTVTVADGNGVMRQVDLLVPVSYNNKVGRAVSIAYHGAGGHSSDARAFGLQDAAGASDAAIFAFPQGIAYETYGVGWDDTCGGYDMPLFDNMLTYLKANYCIDASRVFVSGFSWGCDQVTALACCRGNRIRGVAAASCTDEFADPKNASTYQNLPCPTSPAAGIRFTHETLSDSAFPAPLFATTLSLYRSFNACSDTATASSPAPCRAFTGCGRPLVDCPYDGLGHQLPPNFGNDTWAFFSSL